VVILPPGFPENKRKIARGDRDGFAKRTVKVKVAAEIEVVVSVGDTGAHDIILSSIFFVLLFLPFISIL